MTFTKFHSTAALMLFINTCLFAQADILGYQESRWGMSKEMVQKISTIAEPLSEPKEIGLGWVYLQGKIEINALHMTLKYVFDREGKALKSVLLSGNSMNASVGDFTSLNSALVEKYGQPTSSDRNDQICLSVWKSNTTIINLKLVKAPGISHLSIAYTPAAMSESKSKL